jgi:hypothetical protein
MRIKSRCTGHGDYTLFAYEAAPLNTGVTFNLHVAMQSAALRIWIGLAGAVMLFLGARHIAPLS